MVSLLLNESKWSWIVVQLKDSSACNFSLHLISSSSALVRFPSFILIFSPLQCGVHLDQSAGGGGGAGGIGAGSPGSCGPGHQRGPGGTLPHRRSGGGGRPRRHPHKFPGGKAAHAPERRILGRPTWPHIRGVQHVKAQLLEVYPSVWLIAQSNSK